MADAGVLVLLTGGTIGLRAATSSSMERVDVATTVLTVLTANHVAFDSVVLAPASGAELTLAVIFAARDRILADRNRRRGFVVTPLRPPPPLSRRGIPPPS